MANNIPLMIFWNYDNILWNYYTIVMRLHHECLVNIGITFFWIIITGVTME